MLFFFVNFVIQSKWQSSIRRFSQIWLQAKFENIYFKTTFYIFGYLLKPCIKIWLFPLNFGQIMAIGNLPKHLILAHLIFLISLFGYISGKKMAVG
jgi:hypothetical protein